MDLIQSINFNQFFEALKGAEKMPLVSDAEEWQREFKFASSFGEEFYHKFVNRRLEWTACDHEVDLNIIKIITCNKCGRIFQLEELLNG